MNRRDFLKLVGIGVAGPAVLAAASPVPAVAKRVMPPQRPILRLTKAEAQQLMQEARLLVCNALNIPLPQEPPCVPSNPYITEYFRESMECLYREEMRIYSEHMRIIDLEARRLIDSLGYEIHVELM